MSEEEIIKDLQKYVELINKEYCDECNELNVISGKYCNGSRNVARAIQGLLDLYKQEKEKNKELQNYMKEYLIPKSTINLLYISKDKIREKIKELDKKAKQQLKGVKGQDRYFIKQIYHSKRSFGEELLEEE